jgi:hypothetical protein
MVELLPRPLLVRTAVVYLEAWKMFTENILVSQPSWTNKKSFYPEAEFLDKIQTKVFRVFSLLFTVISTALPSDFFFFKLTQPLSPLPYVNKCTVYK